MGKISSKVLGSWNKSKLNRITRLEEFELANARARDIKDNLRIRLFKNNLNASFKIYSLSQNLLSYFSDERAFRKYAEIVGPVEDDYMPSYPPMSPLTTSYFTYWCFCDLTFDQDKETICSIFHDCYENRGLESKVLEALNHLGASQMRFYQHLGFEDDLILLKDLLTGQTSKYLCTSGYKGSKNEIWFARSVPNLEEIYTYGIVLTTPYVIVRNTAKDWKAFFERQGITSEDDSLMKHHPDYNYWHEYIMDAYVNYTENCIYLTGIPDIKGSKPHEMDEW
ncbi:MAG: hypothetical protein AAF847_12145 [Bacteroidota bacterium]